MSDKKPNPNPFIRMAQQAQEKQAGIPVITGKGAKKQAPPKPTQGFGNKVMRKTGRGG
jgi:hypothetical protein